jgi:uncharacterized membrane protein YczE
MKKISEMPGENGLALLRQEEWNSAQRRRENLKLGGLMTLLVGVGLMIFLRAIDSPQSVYLVALIPFLVGFPLLAYSYFFLRKGRFD